MEYFDNNLRHLWIICCHERMCSVAKCWLIRWIVILNIKGKATDQPSEQSPAKVAKTVPAIHRDKWQPKWDKTFPWAEKLESNGQLRAICVWCKDAKKTNSMATCGSPNLQGSTFSKHEKTQEHLLAAKAHRVKGRQETVPQVFNIRVLPLHPSIHRLVSLFYSPLTI